jgi:hypothetical protein
LKAITDTIKIVFQVSRDGAAERRPSGHSDGLSGGAGTTRPPAPAHRHRTLQTKINHNFLLHHVLEREAEPIFVKTFSVEPRNRDSASLCSLAGAGTKNRIPARQAGNRLLGSCIRSTNTGSVLMQTYFFCNATHPQFLCFTGHFFFLFWLNKLNKKTLFPCENWILHKVNVCVF